VTIKHEGQGLWADSYSTISDNETRRLVEQSDGGSHTKVDTRKSRLSSVSRDRHVCGFHGQAKHTL